MSSAACSMSSSTFLRSARRASVSSSSFCRLDHPSTLAAICLAKAAPTSPMFSTARSIFAETSASSRRARTSSSTGPFAVSRFRRTASTRSRKLGVFTWAAYPSWSFTSTACSSDALLTVNGLQLRCFT